MNHDFFICSSPKLIAMLKALFNCILKIVKLFYDVSKANNYCFATYHSYYINRLAIIELTYNLYLLYRCKIFDIVGLQTENILILVKDFFTTIEKNSIKAVKFMTKNCTCFFHKMFIKFNSI